MKLSKSKVTYPGRKQIFRIRGKGGRFVRDILGLEKEKINGLPLLIKVVNKGKIVYKAQPLEKIRNFAKNNLSGFPESLKDVYPKYKYPVVVSLKLERLRRALVSQLKKRQ